MGFLLYQRFEIQLIQLLDPAELNPRLRGDLRLTDDESQEVYEVTVSDSLVRAYEQEIAGFLGGLERFCQRRQIGYRRALTDVPFEEFVLGGLRSGAGLLR